MPLDQQIIWNELASVDVDASAAFYQELFGWKSTSGSYGRYSCVGKDVHFDREGDTTLFEKEIHFDK